jgi:hypothetical protein
MSLLKDHVVLILTSSLKGSLFAIYAPVNILLTLKEIKHWETNLWIWKNTSYRMGWDSIVTCMGWTDRGLNLGGGEIFPHPTRLVLGNNQPLHNEYWGSLPGVKLPKRGVTHAPPSSAKVKENVELYISYSSQPSWPIVGRTFLFFTFTSYKISSLWRFP